MASSYRCEQPGSAILGRMELSDDVLGVDSDRVGSQMGKCSHLPLLRGSLPRIELEVKLEWDGGLIREGRTHGPYTSPFKIIDFTISDYYN